MEWVVSQLNSLDRSATCVPLITGESFRVGTALFLTTRFPHVNFLNRSEPRTIRLDVEQLEKENRSAATFVRIV